MERSGKAGIATFVMHGKEQLVAIFASGGLLRAETLRFADELRAPADVGLPPAQPADPQRVRALRRAIQRKTKAAFDPHELKDGHWAQLAELVARKEARGRDVIRPESPEAEQRADVIDLLAILKQSLGSGAPKQRAKRPAGSRTPHAKAGARERSKAPRRVRPSAGAKRARRASSPPAKRRAKFAPAAS